MTCPHLKKNLCRLFDKYTVAHTEHNILVKSSKKIFSNFVAFSENPNFTHRSFLRKYTITRRDLVKMQFGASSCNLVLSESCSHDSTLKFQLIRSISIGPIFYRDPCHLILNDLFFVKSKLKVILLFLPRFLTIFLLLLILFRF